MSLSSDSVDSAERGFKLWIQSPFFAGKLIEDRIGVHLGSKVVNFSRGNGARHHISITSHISDGSGRDDGFRAFKRATVSGHVSASARFLASILLTTFP